MKASPWDNGSKEPCPRTQRSGHGHFEMTKVWQFEVTHNIVLE